MSVSSASESLRVRRSCQITSGRVDEPDAESFGDRGAGDGRSDPGRSKDGSCSRPRR